MDTKDSKIKHDIAEISSNGHNVIHEKVYEKAINVKLHVNQEKSNNNSNEKVLRYHLSLSLTQ